MSVFHKFVEQLEKEADEARATLASIEARLAEKRKRAKEDDAEARAEKKALKRYAKRREEGRARAEQIAAAFDYTLI
jgi:Asp-tRNA(Asn)/Glu-tRNA(Gln) amidotransferase C subunit